jgi:DNA (cytosine-5)-methyltransferase 1
VFRSEGDSAKLRQAVRTGLLAPENGSRVNSIKKAEPYQAKGTEASWYKGRTLTEEERARFRRTTLASQAAKAKAVRGDCSAPKHPVPVPRLMAEHLMPVRPPNTLRVLSLFSGGGGLDIGFERAGFDHIASYEIREDAATVLRAAKKQWTVYGGVDGDVCHVNWERYKGTVDVLHGGPPCQPFSHAGYQSGENDVRDMFPQLVRAVQSVEPLVFVAENVPGLSSKKFSQYLQKTIYDPLAGKYSIRMFTLEAASFGVPQRRRRVWFVGFRNRTDANRFRIPGATHTPDQAPVDRLHFDDLPPTMGAREALGLPPTGYDSLAPTLRSGLTGPRHTTSVLSSVTALKQWGDLGIWPNGVAADRERAAAFIAANGHFRLSIPDCMLLQGFPSDWPIQGPVYKCLGLIGNSVAPPMAYRVALAVAHSLGVG